MVNQVVLFESQREGRPHIFLCAPAQSAFCCQTTPVFSDGFQDIRRHSRCVLVADLTIRCDLQRKVEGDRRIVLVYTEGQLVTLRDGVYNIPIEKVLIDPEKVAVDGENVLITSENPLIEAVIDGLNANKNTTENAKKLFAHMSFDGVFGRNDIIDIVNISITAAGNLINKLKEAELIEPVIGQGKGKYKFAEPKK